mmetsp:Transcript_13340/g.20319  ORF Transcript_13340/g.20319 Transcript_13340/m.20319 type:complete len:92 (+) Transcript_13340:943-1218(+)
MVNMGVSNLVVSRTSRHLLAVEITKPKIIIEELYLSNISLNPTFIAKISVIQATNPLHSGAPYHICHYCTCFPHSDDSRALHNCDPLHHEG